MKKILLIAVSCISIRAIGQCPSSINLTGQGNDCLGTMLTVAPSTGSNYTKIVWSNGSTAVDTVLVAPNNGVIVAGGNGAGAAANQLEDVWAIYVDASGNLYVSDVGNSRVQKWAPGATSGVTVAGGNGTGNAANQFNGNTGVFVDGSGNIYVIDEYNSRVQKWAAGATSGVTVAGGNGTGSAANQLDAALQVFVDASGDIYVTDALNERVQEWLPGATSGITVAGGNGQGNGANQFSGTEGVFVDGNGNLYVCDLSNDRVQKWAPGATSGVTVAGGNGQGNAANQLYYPSGIYVYANGTMLIADFGNNRVQEWAPGATSGVTIAGPVIGTGLDQLESPSYVWVDVNGNIYVADLSNFRVLKFGPSPGINRSYAPLTPDTYTALVTDEAGCTTRTNPVVINPTVVPSASIQTLALTICSGTQATFTASPVNGGSSPSYQWLLNGSVVGTDSISYSNGSLSDGDIVECMLTSNAVCASPATAISNNLKMSVKPAVIPSVSITASPDRSCSGTLVSFNAAVANAGISPSYQWQVNSNPVGANAPSYSSVTLRNKDTVICIVTGDGACDIGQSNTIVMTVDPSPEIPPGQVFTVPAGQSIQLSPVITGDISSYLWTPGTGLSDSTVRDPFVHPSVTISYKLEVVSTDGCKSFGDVLVKAFTDIRVPDAFTPNGDGRNDIFFVLGGPPGAVIEEMAIFNRWGELVFHALNINPGDRSKGWDGNCNGKPCASGAYVYTIKARLAGGILQNMQGSFILVR